MMPNETFEESPMLDLMEFVDIDERVKQVVFHDAMLKLFWTYVVERQMIFHRRHVLGEAPPWTTIPILQEGRWPNVYREQDAGTKYEMAMIWENEKFDAAEAMRHSMVYRFFNRYDTYEIIKPLIEVFDQGWAHDSRYLVMEALKPQLIKAIGDALIAKKAAGAAIFTDSYQSGFISIKDPNAPGAEKNKRPFDLPETIWEIMYAAEEVASLVGRGGSLFEAYNRLRKIKYVGPFMGYQMVLSTTYPVARWGQALAQWNHPGSTPDSLVKRWISPGPGAKHAVKTLVDHDKNREQNLFVIIRAIHDTQIEALKRFGLFDKMMWMMDNDDHPVLLSVANIEHCLCEMHRFFQYLSGESKGKKWQPGLSATKSMNFPTELLSEFTSLPIYGKKADVTYWYHESSYQLFTIRKDAPNQESNWLDHCDELDYGMYCDRWFEFALNDGGLKRLLRDNKMENQGI